MSLTVDDLLKQALSGEGVAADASGDDVEIDVAELVEDLGKTAEFLEKTAEALPHTPEFVAAQKKMMMNPLNSSRRDIHTATKKWFSSVLPGAANSTAVPESLEDVEDLHKKASVGGAQSFLERIRRNRAI